MLLFGLCFAFVMVVRAPSKLRMGKCGRGKFLVHWIRLKILFNFYISELDRLLCGREKFVCSEAVWGVKTCGKEFERALATLWRNLSSRRLSEREGSWCVYMLGSAFSSYFYTLEWRCSCWSKIFLGTIFSIVYCKCNGLISTWGCIIYNSCVC